MAQWLMEGLTATISGVLTVFLVLILIALIIGSLQFIINPKKTMALMREKSAQKKLMKENANIEVAEPKTALVVEQAPVQDELELVAVITATIAASLGVSSDKLQVRSIRRVGQSNSWNRRA